MTAPRPRRVTPPRQRRAEEPPPPPEHPPITLITGTDTGVGKTWIACALARALIATGQRVVAIKPIETGCGDPSRTEDGVLLAKATGQSAPGEALVRLRASVAAAVAADAEGVTIELEPLIDRIKAAAKEYDLTLVEGTGGLLTPLTWHDNLLDLAHGLAARVLVVSGDRLGTINHTLLTLRALQAEKVPVLGVVLTTPPAPDQSTGTNADAIRRLSGVDLVWPVPYLADPHQTAEAVKEVAGWLLP